MEFTIEFYEDENGKAPVREFLEEVKAANVALHALLLAGLAKLRQRSYHRPPLSKHVEGPLYELRVGRRDTARIIYFFRKGRRIVLLHGFVKKTRRLPRREIETALRRMRDYLRRHPDE